MPAEKYGIIECTDSYMINDFCQIGWSDPFPQPQRDNQENFQDPRPTPDEIYNYIEEVKQTNKEKM